MEVYKAINAVQAALAKTGISKDRRNQQQGYNFRGIDDVYAAIAPLLAGHGLCILPRVTSRDVVERVTKSGGTLFYTTLTVEFDFVSSSDGSKHTICTVGEAMDSGDKSSNKAMSAAMKYACLMAFAVPTEADNDADAQTHEVAGQPNGAVDDSPKAVARRLCTGVSAGDAAGAAIYLAGMPRARLDAIWALIDGPTQDKLTAAWPKD